MKFQSWNLNVILFQYYMLNKSQIDFLKSIKKISDKHF